MHAITLFAWLGSHSQTRSTLVVVPYLPIEMSRHAHHSSSSLHLHGCKCMDAGINRPSSCRVRRQLTRTDMMVDVAAAQSCVTCTSKIIIVLTFLFHSSPPTCFFNGIACLVSTATCEATTKEPVAGPGIYPMQRQSRLLESNM
jgi:hypothetical protein